MLMSVKPRHHSMYPFCIRMCNINNRFDEKHEKIPLDNKVDYIFSLSRLNFKNLYFLDFKLTKIPERLFEGESPDVNFQFILRKIPNPNIK